MQVRLELMAKFVIMVIQICFYFHSSGELSENYMTIVICYTPKKRDNWDLR